MTPFVGAAKDAVSTFGSGSVSTRTAAPPAATRRSAPSAMKRNGSAAAGSQR